MLNKILLLLVVFLPLLTIAQQHKVLVLSQDEFKKGIGKKNIQLVDVRTPDEYKNGHIKNAKNIDYKSPSFKNEISKLDKTKPVYLYCQAGGRSAKASLILSELGFVEVYDLSGGYSSWNK
jgi:rhodanese-related sulfurtransferase